MPRRQTIRQILERLIDFFTDDIRSAFLASIQNVVDNVVLADVVKAISEGDLDKAFRALGFSDAAMRPLTAAIERAFETGGVTIGETFPKLLNTPNGRTVFRFDVRDSRAEAWLRDQSSTLVTAIKEDTREAVRNVLNDGMRAGVNPRTAALDLVGRVDATGKRVGGVIGLTPGQERWVTRTRQMLEELDPAYLNRKLRDKRFDKIVARAIKDGKPLPADTIQKLVTRYKANALRYRGETIGRTEAIQALNRSEQEAIQQAVAMGATKASTVQRVWESAGDDGRTRDTHLQMDGQTVGLDEPFTFPGGAQAMFPGDTSLGAPPEETINCRCRFRLKIDWLAAAVEPAPVIRAL